jgi:hypothetical protein
VKTSRISPQYTARTCVTTLIFLTAFSAFVSQASAGEAKHLEFAITKGTNPGGAGSYTGKLVFKSGEAGEAIAAAWTLSNGTASGWAVPFPGSDYIAVGYGRDLGGVAIYQRQKDGSSKTHYALAGAGQKIGSYTLVPGTPAGHFKIKGGAGGTVDVSPGPERVFDLKWNLDSGKWHGMGVADGDFLAAASTTGGSDYGVVIYRKNSIGADGWWRYGGGQGVGTEVLKMAKVDGKAVPEVSAVDATPRDIADNAADEARALGKALRGNIELPAKMKPNAEQISAIAATGDDARLLTAYVEKLFADLPPTGLGADPGQQEVRHITQEDLPTMAMVVRRLR